MNLFVFNTKLLKSLEYTNHLKIIVIYMLFSWVDIFKQKYHAYEIRGKGIKSNFE